MSLERARLCGVLLLASACAHEESFESNYTPLAGPLEPGPPVIIARSALEDQFASWLPDGSGILYSYIPDPDGPRDRCLGLLPPGGGQIYRSRCYRLDLANDSTDVLGESAARSAEEVAWVEQHNLAGRLVPDYGAITVGALSEAAQAQRLVTFPYVAASGSVHATATSLRWLSATQLAYIGNDIVVRALCKMCRPDTVIVAKEVMLLDRRGGPPQVLAGSEQTTSIWPTADGTGLYYTLGGDTRVWRRAVAGGTPEMVHDFGPAGIVRDISVAGNRLSAIVGGNVSYGPEQNIPLRQIDSGGNLATVNLTTGEATVLQIEKVCFRRPALSPSGHAVVVEQVDSTGPNPNLLLYPLP
jgi:hypothetical protein